MWMRSWLGLDRFAVLLWHLFWVHSWAYEKDRSVLGSMGLKKSLVELVVLDRASVWLSGYGYV